MLEIATRARASKRELYAEFAGKQDIRQVDGGLLDDCAGRVDENVDTPEVAEHLIAQRFDRLPLAHVRAADERPPALRSDIAARRFHERLPAARRDNIGAIYERVKLT